MVPGEPRPETMVALRMASRGARTPCLGAGVVRAACERGGPAVLNLDAINRGNNLWYVERFEATSPGGEQPLPPYGACCGGSVNLARFVLDPFSSGARFDHGAFARVVAVGVEMLDRVLDVTAWPLPQHAAEAAAKRMAVSNPLILRRPQQADGRLEARSS